MTIEEAIIMLDYIKNGSGDWCGSLGEGRTGIALDMSIEALEKQIPKKFEIDEWYPRDRFCPRCFEDFTKTDARCQDYEPWRYCPSCGQAIDWSENNE